MYIILTPEQEKIINKFIQLHLKIRGCTISRDEAIKLIFKKIDIAIEFQTKQHKQTIRDNQKTLL